VHKNSRNTVAGHKGLVGSAILRNLQSKGYSNLLTANKKDLDLTDTDAVEKYFAENKIEYSSWTPPPRSGVSRRTTTNRQTL
jgi:GDP-L-fucose synthase